MVVIFLPEKMLKKKPKNRVRVSQRCFRATADEWKIIEKKIEQSESGCFSTYARKMLIDGQIMIISRYELEAIKELSIELNRIGNNINQIARIANSTNKVFKAETVEVLERQKEISRLLGQIKDRRNIKVN